MSVTRYDRSPVKAKFTEDGYLEDSPVLTRTGVFVYRDGKGGIRRELRHPDDVFKADSLASYKNKPITKGHPGKVNADNLKSHHIGTITSVGRQDGDNIVADSVIHDPRVIKQDGWKELSVGYSVDLIPESGEYNGEKYDSRQTNIRVNHVAVVPEGRAGNSRLNLDAADAVEFQEDDKEGGKSMPQIRLDNGISYDAAEEVVQAHEKLRSDHAETVKALEVEKARADAAEADKKKLEDEREKLKQDAREEARARIELEATAKEHKVEIKQDSTDRAIKEGVIKAIRGDSVDMSGKSDDYVSAAFDFAIENSAKQRSDAADQRITVNQPRNDSVAPEKTAQSSRETMIARLRGEKLEA
ncbi:hypothetical protein R84981_002775 [Carnimonas sp. R-84981]|uniref:DUF2213 domain-containing protein n=1 Tax=Carnimonas bestiolae TaxID=3402172 RepID=UPI003EDC24F6